MIAPCLTPGWDATVRTVTTLLRSERGWPMTQAVSTRDAMILPMAVDDDEESNQSLRPVQGQVSYLQIPAINVKRSAEFYARVFGWHIEHPHPGFDAPGLIGQWVTDRPPTPNAGMLPWLHVDSMTDAMKLVRAHGGEVLEHPTPDGPERLLSTVRDPAGNVLGLVQLVAR